MVDDNLAETLPTIEKGHAINGLKDVAVAAMSSYPVVSDKMLNTSLIFQDSIKFIKHNCGNTFVSEIAAFLDNFFKSSFFT